MEEFESMIETRMRRAVEDAKKDCSEKSDYAGCGCYSYLQSFF